MSRLQARLLTLAGARAIRARENRLFVKVACIRFVSESRVFGRNSVISV